MNLCTQKFCNLSVKIAIYDFYPKKSSNFADIDCESRGLLAPNSKGDLNLHTEYANFYPPSCNQFLSPPP